MYLGPYSSLRRSEGGQRVERGREGCEEDRSSSVATMAYLRSLRSTLTRRPSHSGVDVHDGVSLLPEWHRREFMRTDMKKASESRGSQSTHSQDAGDSDCRVPGGDGADHLPPAPAPPAPAVHPTREPSTRISDSEMSRTMTVVDDDLPGLRTRMAKVVRL